MPRPPRPPRPASRRRRWPAVERRKRNRRFVLFLVVVALAGAALGSMLAGRAAGAESGPVTITCPTGGGASATCDSTWGP
jgi:uncharacterized membrane protein